MEIGSTSNDQIRLSLQKSTIETRYQTERQLERIVQPDRQDRVEISGSAIERSRLQSVLLQRMEAMPDVREDKVALARERMATGFYERGDVVSKLGDRMLESGTLRVEPEGASELPETSYRKELMGEVNAKMQGGFYSDNDVMSFVADRLLQIYGIADDEGVSKGS